MKKRGRKSQANFKKLLREIRLEANLHQSELSQRLGVPQSFVSKYESGERRLDFLEINEICKAIGIPLAKFVERFEKIME